MKTLYIAEKPDIATAIAAHLWPNNYLSHKTKTCYKCGDTTVTWAFGHILMTAMPEAYGEEFKNFSRYPVFPKEWIKIPSPAAKEQLTAIRKMLKTADVVVNGGDPDREGQLLVDEILDYCGYRGKVNRILINAKDSASMKRAFESIVPDEKFRNLYEAGKAREQADWLVGINLSRAYSVSARKNGMNGIWRIGRVKMPTLALVVSREREIENFRPVDYFTMVGKYTKDGMEFAASLCLPDNAPTDSEGRVLDRSYLDGIVREIEGRESNVVSVERKSGFENAPLPYSLDTLQVEANSRYGMSPSFVLKSVQALYERKLVSYPRSDCNYIPASQHSDAARILMVLGNYGMKAAREASPNIKSRAFNDSKISAHHALIPTGVAPKDINEWESRIYEMIATRYILQFYPPCTFNTLNYRIECCGYFFKGSGKVITSLGWKMVSKGCDAEPAESLSAESGAFSLPELNIGDILLSPIYEISSFRTKPPKRFTEGTLLAAMTNIWKFVSKDNPNRERLKECNGIGTPATRDTIISELMAEVSGKGSANLVSCIKKVGKELVPTPFGRCLIDNIDETLTSPEFTAIMEYNLSSISEGKMAPEAFMNDITDLIRKNIAFAENNHLEVSSGMVADKNGMNGKSEETEFRPLECPVCHKNTLVRKYSKKTGKHFWVCSDEGCVHPVTKKVFFYDDNDGSPFIKACPDCGNILMHGLSQKTKRYYWRCLKCDKFVNEK